MSGTIVDTAQTYGWDTVFSVVISDVNAAIVAAGTSPLSWSQADEPDGYTAFGTFGAWTIMTGGSGDLIYLSLPMPSITVVSPSGTAQAAGNATVQVRLNLLAEETNSQNQSLVVNTTNAPDYPVASVVEVNFTSLQPSFLNQAAIQALLGTWLNNNVGDFNQVFATIELGRTADTQAFQWMQPTTTSYAYADLGSAADGALALLSMTEGRSAAGLVQEVSSVCLPSGARAALLISKARVMDQILLPSLPATFSGASSADFALSSDGESIVNSGSGVSFSVTDSDGNQYDATIVAFSASISGDCLFFDTTTSTQLAAGIYAYARAQNELTISLGTNSNGEQALTFGNASDPIITHWTDADPGYSITEELLAVAALAAALIATVLTDGAAAGTIALAIGFAAGALTVTQDAIQDAGNNGAPAITASIIDVAGAFTWAQGSGLTLTSAGLNDSLQLAGVLTTAE